MSITTLEQGLNELTTLKGAAEKDAKKWKLMADQLEQSNHLPDTLVNGINEVAARLEDMAKACHEKATKLVNNEVTRVVGQDPRKALQFIRSQFDG